MLCMFVIGQKCQSVHLKLKQCKPGKPQPVLVLPAYPVDKRLCVVAYLEGYLTKTESVRRSERTRLLLSYSKSHKPVSQSSILRWVRTVMVKSGKNTVHFKPHSIQAASTSAAIRKGIPLETIMAAPRWSTDCTFATYYNKDIKEDTKYGQSVVICFL